MIERNLAWPTAPRGHGASAGLHLRNARAWP